MPHLPPDFGKITPNPVPFSSRLSGLVAVELADAKGDHDRVAEIIERLAYSLAFVVAIACRGDAKDIGTMLDGVTAHLYEEATGHAKIGAALEVLKRREAR